jgi:hypothetical protein
MACLCAVISPVVELFATSSPVYYTFFTDLKNTCLMRMAFVVPVSVSGYACVDACTLICTSCVTIAVCTFMLPLSRRLLLQTNLMLVVKCMHTGNIFIRSDWMFGCHHCIA